MLKSIKLLFNGFVGIVINSHLDIRMKVVLLYDFIHLILYAFFLIIFARKQIESDKTFNIKSFKYKVYFKNMYAFLFLFNEIFCKAEYTLDNKLKLYIDLGSNIGLLILWYYYFNPHMTIMAFEPDEENLYYLRQNLEENVFTKYKIYRVALTNKISKSKFYRIHDRVQNLDSGLSLNQPLDHTTVLVRTNKLSHYIKDKHVSLIKMDIEGSEYSVMEDLISSKYLFNIEEIIFESHYFNAGQVKTYNDLVSSLKKYGFLLSFKTSKITSLNHWFNKNYQS